MQYGVALAEGSPLAVLAGQPHALAGIGRRREGECLGRGPVERPLAFRHLGAGGDEAAEVAVQVEALGQLDHSSQIAAELRFGNPRVRFRDVLRAAPDERVPDPVVGLRARLFVHSPGGGERSFKPLLLALDVDLGLLGLDLSEFEQVLEVVDPDRIARADPVVQHRLRERGLVTLVVAAAPVAVEVDHHIPLVALAEVERDVDDPGHRLGLLAIDVEDRYLEHLRDVGAVGVRARTLGRRREPDLVVHDDVERAADVVGGKLGQVERLLDDPLAGEGGVAVDEEQHGAVTEFIADPVLLGPHASHRHRVDEL